MDAYMFSSFSEELEEEHVLGAIFKDKFPDSWKESADFIQYMKELTSQGIDTLTHEPERLSEEKSQILEQTQDLAFNNYKTFIKTAECSKEIFQDFNSVDMHVNNLLEKIPDFSGRCKQFMQDAQDIGASRKLNSLILSRHTQLLELLEVPQLMDTCVRNNYYDEALELTAYVRRLEKKYSDIRIIRSIVNDVKSLTQLMLLNLIQQLRTNIQLPQCLRIVGYLRQMDLFTEAELRIKFLQARDVWFQSLLRNIRQDDTYTYITKTIEASRVHLFDIITQYRAIFSDDDPIITTIINNPTSDSGVDERGLFHGWVIQKVTDFLTILSNHLLNGVSGRLDSLLGQCMYFGLSFSRVGADFRGLIAPMFQQAALHYFKLSVESATDQFEELMQSYTLVTQPLSSVPGSNHNTTMQKTVNHNPPTVLLQHPPLAWYCNSILTAFNDLRLCAPVAIAANIADILDASMCHIVQCIVAFHRAEESAFNEKEQDLFAMMCSVIAQDLVPYLHQCFNALYPNTLIAQTMGLTLNDFQNLTFARINVKLIVEPLYEFLPQEPESERVSTEDHVQYNDSSRGADERIETEPPESPPILVTTEKEISDTESETGLKLDQQAEDTSTTDPIDGEGGGERGGRRRARFSVGDDFDIDKSSMDSD